jgi:hypothetical protein
MARHLMAAAVLLMAAGIAGAQAEAYPARTVTIIVPFAAGGPADITGRIVADIFNHHLGQKFVVENAGGAGGTVGTPRAARAAADGYTILSGHLGTNALAPAFYPDLGYDPQRISSRSDSAPNILNCWWSAKTFPQIISRNSLPMPNPMLFRQRRHRHHQTSTWNHKSVLRPILRDGHFVTSSG